MFMFIKSRKVERSAYRKIQRNSKLTYNILKLDARKVWWLIPLLSWWDLELLRKYSSSHVCISKNGLTEERRPTWNMSAIIPWAGAIIPWMEKVRWAPAFVSLLSDYRDGMTSYLSYPAAIPSLPWWTVPLSCELKQTPPKFFHLVFCHSIRKVSDRVRMIMWH